MKVLQINKLYHPHTGGVEKVVREIAEGFLLRRVDVDMEVLACSPRGAGSRDAVNGVRVTRAASVGIYNSMPVSPHFPLLLKKMSADKDILHFHEPFPLGALSCLLVKPRAKIVVWWHSDIVRQKTLLKFYRPVLNKFLERADRIITATARLVEFSEILKPYAHKCVVIPFGMNLDRFLKAAGTDAGGRTPTDAGGGAPGCDIRRRYGERVVLFVGRLVYYKGVEHLIRAMREVRGRALIVGDGPLDAQLRRLAIRCGVADRVAFLGRVDDAALPAYYHACDVFVLPSTAASEAFGLVQIEAMACAVPVVNTMLPSGVPEVSVDSVTGLTVRPGDAGALAGAINRLLDDAALREKYGRAAAEAAEKRFSLPLMLDKIYGVYEELLQK
jgi:rhamnosyl/mannosyltransferase